MYVSLRDCVAGRFVGVEDPPPIGIDLVNVVAIPERVGAVLTHQVGDLTPRRVRLRQILAQAMGHIDPKSVHPAVGPEAQCVTEVGPHFLVLPVEIRLLRGEEVEVPLPITGWCPGRSTEKRFPVVGRQLTASAQAVAEEITITFRSTAARGECLYEPRVPIGGVIGHDVDDHLDASCVQRPGHLVEVVQAAELRGDIAVIINVRTCWARPHPPSRWIG
jgi:hypothetical protein